VGLAAVEEDTDQKGGLDEANCAWSSNNTLEHVITLGYGFT